MAPPHHSPSLQRRRGGTVRGAPERPHRHVALVTQGCHASVAAIWSHKDDPHTLDYCDPTHLDSMHKVTLEVKGQTQIVNLSEKIKAGGIAHKLWIEPPENIPTCLATKPYPKSIVSSFFKKLKLCK